MGMYDHIKCEYPLPDKEVQKETFQTKDFDNVMEDYTITTSGVLIRHKTIWEPVPEEERPYYGKPEWNESPFFQIAGSIKTIPIGDEEIPYHGMVQFYTIYNGTFYEYQAKFTDGLVVEIKRIEPIELKH